LLKKGRFVLHLVTIAVASLLLVPAAASAQSMNAEEFYRRATTLQKKGPMALFSRGEIKLLTNEGTAAGRRAREQRLAALQAGTRPRYCPPQDVQGMDSSEFLKRLGAIPEAERARIDMLEATNRLLASKYPCKR
jgi:hypothetical protein